MANLSSSTCPICGGRSAYALTKDQAPYLQCQDCEFLFCGEKIDPILPVDYEGDYWIQETHEAERREREDCFLRSLELIYLSERPVHNILDFGCGLGITVEMLREKLGINAVGVDPFGQFDENDHLHKCYLDQLREKYPAGYFDAIISVEVFEHLVDPKSVLPQLLYFLNDQGKLLVNTGTLEYLKRDDPEMHY